MRVGRALLDRDRPLCLGLLSLSDSGGAMTLAGLGFPCGHSSLRYA